MKNCILCDKPVPHTWIICGHCQANGQVHPLTDEALIKYEAREKENERNLRTLA